MACAPIHICDETLSYQTRPNEHYYVMWCGVDFDVEAEPAVLRAFYVERFAADATCPECLARFFKETPEAARARASANLLGGPDRGTVLAAEMAEP